MSVCKVEVKQEVDSDEDEGEMEETTQKVYLTVGGVKVLVGEGRMICKPPQRKKRVKAVRERIGKRPPQKRKMKEETREEKKARPPPKKRTSSAELLKKKREYQKLKRQNETPEQRAERLRKDREAKRRKNTSFQSDDWGEKKETHTEKRRRLMAEETPEGQAERERRKRYTDTRREKRRLEREQRLLKREPGDEERTMTEEEKEKRERKLEEKRRWWKETEEKKRSSETPEEWAERRRRKNEESRRRYREKWRLLGEEPETEEERKKKEELEEKRRKMEFERLVKKATMTEEEKEAQRMKNYLGRQAWLAKKGRWRDQPQEWKDKVIVHNLEWRHSLEGERKKRYRESVKRAVNKYVQNLKAQPEKWRERREKFAEWQRRQYASETPEEREKRRFKEKVNAARRKLRRRLQQEGVQVEEIARRDEELRVQMWREFDPDIDLTQRKRPGPKPKVLAESTSPLPKGEMIEDKERGHGRKEPSALNPNFVRFPPTTTTMPATFLHKNEIELHSEPGGIHDQVEELQEDHFSPAPSPEAPPSPSNSEYQEAPDPLLCQPANLKKEASLPPVNSKDTLQCAHCSSKYSTDSQLRTHIVCCHPSKCWKCPKCKEVVLSPLELSQHYNTAHKPINQEPPRSPQDPEPNLKPKFVCLCCRPTKPSHGSHFRTRLELFSHVKLKHSKNYWPCAHCSLLKYSQKSLDLHLQICGRYRMEAP